MTAVPSFESLRKRQQPGSRFFAIVEVERFLLLRPRIGFQTAEAILGEFSSRIAALIEGVAIGRINRGSIEIAFAAPDRDRAAEQLRSIIHAVGQRLVVNGFDFTLTAIIGAVELGARSIDDAMLDLAAAAVVDAQRRHEQVLIVREVEQPLDGGDDMALLRDMPQAIVSGDLQVHYQPKLRSRTNRIEAAEALVRWHHPTRGPVAIEPFIRLVEETGAIRRLTEWVIGHAVLDRGRLESAGHDLTLWVNLSGLLVPDEDFTARALDLVRGSEAKLGFEITETAVIGDPQRAMANLARYNAAGVKLAIDDYGSGLSSLAYLKQLPAQELKIDRLFIKDLVESHRDPLLVRSSIDLAHALEMEVTAEGVDDPMALALLRVMGCDLIQGYIVAPALPLGELISLLADKDRVERLATPAVSTAWQTPPNSRQNRP